MKKRKGDNFDTATNNADATADALSMTSEEEHIDIGYLLAPLSRRTLELFVLQLLDEQPEYANNILRLSRQAVNDIELQIDLLNIFASSYERQDEITSQLTEYIERADAYATANDVCNTCLCLWTICDCTIKWYIAERRRGEGEDAGDIANAQSLFQQLEAVWSNAIQRMIVNDDMMAAAAAAGTATNGGSQQIHTSNSDGSETLQQLSKVYVNPETARYIDTKRHTELLNSLQQWCKQLTTYVGPIFSEQIRALRKKALLSSTSSSGENTQRGRH